MWTPGPIHLTRFHNEDKKNDVSWREANASRFKVARFVQGPEALASVRTWYEHMHLIYKCYVSILLTQSYTLEYTVCRLLILGIYCFDKSHLMIIQNTFGATQYGGMFNVIAVVLQRSTSKDNSCSDYEYFCRFCNEPQILHLLSTANIITTVLIPIQKAFCGLA